MKSSPDQTHTFLPVKHLHLKTSSSTQDIVSGLNSNWVLARSDEQTAGRGSKNRSWSSPPGGLYYSLKFPAKNSEVSNGLILIGAASVWMDVLRNHFPGLTGELNLKWPNDLLLDDKKLAGFLGEQSEGSFRLGVGINVNNDLDGSDFRLEATSLREQLETDVDSTSILFNWYRGFVDCLDRADECRHFEPEELESRLGTMGKEVIVENTRGEVLGLDTNGALRVDFNGDKRSIHRTDQVEILHQ